MVRFISSINRLGSIFSRVRKDALSSLISISIICSMMFLSQFVMVGSEAIAAPFGKQIDGIKVDMAIDKVAGDIKEISRDLRDGKTDKVIDKVAAVAKDVTKQVGDRTKDLAKDVKEGTKESLNNAKDFTRNAKNEIGDRTDSVLDQTQNFTNKAGEVIDSVKGALK